MSSAYDISRPNFTEDLKYGQVGEELVKQFLDDISSGHLEVKTDRYRNGRMVVEVEQNPRGRGWKPSGLMVTEAKWWVYQYNLDGAFTIVSVERLKRYITHLDEKRDAPHRAGTQGGTDIETAKLQEVLLETQLKHTRTCQALFTLLNHFSQTVSTDVEQQRILDLSRLRNNVIVDSTKAAPFFEWLAANKGIG